jgi:hypothetical protein
MNCSWRDVNALSTIAKIEQYKILEGAGFDTMTSKRAEQTEEDSYLRMRTQAYAEDVGGFWIVVRLNVI